ncbi:DUF6799 domain-containing protein [Rufibacter glacialis]|uniref:DUF6799 domain-containing protein n=1 Tax=Rufibacter glacialis TaxID=1259555 RepID=A0A5M8Q7U4_9BACT|nr:DUF6799 domain-containing protein [Rufibacter glacialis]KAA6431161.1 hypothetical protein FOE74_18900 [Rufibacter glacialis]GGK84607.1 hypothetical protein GCM10011405_35590 [Rufibacter glacialis]
MKRILLYSFSLLLLSVALSCVPHFSLAQQTSDSLITRATIKDNTIFWQQGKLVQHRGGKLYELQEPVQYKNGTVVSPNGQVRLPDGKNYTLKQKNAVNPQGRVVLVADDIFTHTTIIEHEKKVVGDTEIKITTINGQVVSAGNNQQQITYTTAQMKRLQLLEQIVHLLEQRNALLEANLTPAERKGIEAYYNGLNKQLASVNQQLEALSPPVK